ncbi:tRNA (adenosine(37)-N6)-threonylcarbamoyltransferase complex dimerization subunit type 1 TsaB [Sediminicoccus rosea]|jgi:tRNA threonylcarbamoyladenosine biosynthesis protein TsaB|uniref:tRNA (Adenosine(37)-N6)-threonylcarbamoyltransferase complex dimerization subunit type 1 TsaB n=1 Tax=Sediminicoccus rosea TaxID=1225128 RepID=A0ABZ0PKN9_9PROT|nr:tRNA (adenosine(37)-N6)-threonylcarbamoyltransferase complex dimerization subunit type 1 TsaB [Sediminicoccus rosea]WPB86296.1 tRNA (adenosine(37)-N6)-threonylcarbamoyltransferase complex dimerization subunit type 1 TsaB [Sediminicoccus rosea]
MRLLVLDAALSRCLAAMVEEERVLMERVHEGAHGQAAALPPLAEAVLQTDVDAVAVGVGPGSFTGLRTAIALAQGIGLARGIPVIPVTTGEALVAMGDPAFPAWAVTENRRGDLFLERPDAPPCVVAEAALPRPEGLTWIMGDGAPRAVARMRARGWPAGLGDARRIEAAALARVALRRLRGEMPALALEPLYVEPPATT